MRLDRVDYAFLLADRVYVAVLWLVDVPGEGSTGLHVGASKALVCSTI